VLCSSDGDGEVRVSADVSEEKEGKISRRLKGIRGDRVGVTQQSHCQLAKLGTRTRRMRWEGSEKRNGEVKYNLNLNNLAKQFNGYGRTDDQGRPKHRLAHHVSSSIILIRMKR